MIRSALRLLSCIANIICMKHFLLSVLFVVMCMGLVGSAVLAPISTDIVFAQGGGGEPGPTGGGGSDRGPSGGVTGNPKPPRGHVANVIGFLEYVLTNIVLPIGAVVVVFMLIYTGYKFVMAGGNPGEIESARRMLLWVLGGAAILLGSVVIANAIEATVCRIAPGSCSGSSLRL